MTGIDPVQALPRVRQSLLSTFNDCGLQAKFDLDHRQGWGGHRAAGGTIMHRTIARCLELLVDAEEEQVPLDVAMAVFDDVIRQADAPVTSTDGLADTDVIVPLHELRDMRVAVRSWATYTRWNPKTIVAIERRYDIPLTYPGRSGEAVERALTTQLDLLEILDGGEHAVSWDWKSSWTPPAERQRDPDAFDDSDASSEGEGYFQQRVHALVVFRHYPRVQSVTTREFYPRHASAKTENPTRERTFHRHELPELEAEFSALMERFDKSMRAGQWTPAPGTHCSWCPRPAACTIYRDARVAGSVTTREEAITAVGHVQYLEALLKQKRAGLRAYTSEHGPVPVSTPKGLKVYGPTLQTRKITPSQEQVVEAVRRGQDPAQLWSERRVPTVRLHTPDKAHPHASDVDAETWEPPAAAPAEPEVQPL